MRYLAAAALLLAIGCGSDTTEPTIASLAGTWTLQTVNGSAVPYTLPGGTATNKFEIVSGTFILAAGGTYTSTFASRLTSGTSVTNSTDSDAGTYTVTGNTVAIKSNVAGSTADNGTVSGNTISVITVDSGVTYTYVFKKG